MTVIVDIKIHNRVVGVAHISNRGHPEDGKDRIGDDLREYSYDIFDQDSVVVVSGWVRHHRDEGAAELVRRVFSDIPPGKLAR